jgi:hypothetical protein
LAGVSNRGSTNGGDSSFNADAAAAAAASGNSVSQAADAADALGVLRAARSSGSGGLLPSGVAARLLPVLLQLAEVRRRQRRFADAEGLCRRALGVAGMCYPPSHPEVAGIKNALAQVRVEPVSFSAAPAGPFMLFRAAKIGLDKSDCLPGPDCRAGPDLQRFLTEFSTAGRARAASPQVFRMSGALPEAAALHQEALSMLEAALGPEHHKVGAAP